VLAALAFLPDAGVGAAHVLGTQLAQPLLAQSRDEMQTHDAFVALVGLRSAILAYDLTEPVRQILRHCPVHRRDRHALIGTTQQLGQVPARTREMVQDVRPLSVEESGVPP